MQWTGPTLKVVIQDPMLIEIYQMLHKSNASDYFDDDLPQK